MREQDLLVSSAVMAGIDEAAREKLGIPGAVLMENAGRGAWEVLRRVLHTEKNDLSPGPLVFCAGPGNNGGDALVMARWALMEEEFPLAVVTSRASLGAAATAQWDILERMGVTRLVWDEEPVLVKELLGRARMIVDGLSGTGLAGALRGSLVSLVEAMNASPAPIAAVDLPSGFRDGPDPADPRVQADVTIVTGYLKLSLFTPLGRPGAGRLFQVDPGFPPALVRDARDSGDTDRFQVRLVNPEDLPVPLVPADAHKGMRGRVGVIGGAPGTEGAPLLAGLGALYGGAGMVRICSGGGQAAGGYDPSLMVSSDTRESRNETVAWASALVIGPGWTGASREDLQELLQEARERSLPVVADAQALRLLGEDLLSGGGGGDSSRGGGFPLILTPHPGELSAMLGWSVRDLACNPWEGLRRTVETCSAVVVLKGAVTFVADPGGQITLFDGRCPALATAGSGDVLAGLVGAFCAAGMEASKAARTAVAIHLRAGRHLASQRGWFTARDLARSLGTFSGGLS
ncbi:NAD(P)H-hydrate epimerase [Alkalispirochaeta americana]|uniref:Bifunctional NAD(P)H-hydrate repair enzyme n=1 Tax=Alkalispirochaeta americana TaxID=159291 RepID=A0A1N6PP24_9SPIO|nr:NAD(P)H-hydrate dehydratase [Alkalispirochaeta americana]SIQ06023.1 NAD(P)H-hydrate epimerase [Alkalispirochaeta americana]